MVLTVSVVTALYVLIESVAVILILSVGQQAPAETAAAAAPIGPDRPRPPSFTGMTAHWQGS